jgi:hypothetical protein
MLVKDTCDPPFESDSGVYLRDYDNTPFIALSTVLAALYSGNVMRGLSPDDY